ncbi:condensation domain-containing protein, partial [Xanthomonas arboricola]|uniref:condensation domain-containing protein n=1 Tax=Xanthomonas arboricola TaxID=56448 RepID=UPI000D4D58C4
VVVGSPIAGRTHRQTENIVGLFANMLVLRTKLEGNPPFTDILHRVKEVVLDAHAHQSLPFERLVEMLKPGRDLSHQPLFQVDFSFHNFPQQEAYRDSAWTVFEGGRATSKLDLTLAMSQREGRLVGIFTYATDLFDRARIESISGSFQTLLQALALEGAPAIRGLPLLHPDKWQEILEIRSGADASHGEVEHAALSESGSSPRNRELASLTPTQRTLCQIWKELLEVETLSIDENFFEIGGHSLLGARMIARVREELGVELPLRLLFEIATVSELASRIDIVLSGGCSSEAGSTDGREEFAV